MDPLAWSDRLPDDPQHLFVQAALRAPGARVRVGGDGFAVGHLGSGVVGVVGRPDREALLAAASDVAAPWAIVADRGERARLEHLLVGARFLSATQHVLPAGASLPAPRGDVRPLTSMGALEAWPTDLRDELGAALARGVPAWAACLDGQPVAVSYAVHQTPAWWDVSVDCLPAWQRRGLATDAWAALAVAQRAEGREPIWGCLDANTASRRMAAKLGFVPVWEVVVIQGRAGDHAAE